jgi:hypothetical protein
MEAADQSRGDSYVASAALEASLVSSREITRLSAVALRSVQCDVMRDILGNPYRPVPVIDPAWLKWNGGTVRKLARAIYDERRHGELPILADALEEAGCTSADLLEHCRGAGPHFHGCWVLDLLLGKT